MVTHRRSLPFPKEAASAFGSRRRVGAKPMTVRVEFDDRAASAFGRSSSAHRDDSSRREFPDSAASAFSTSDRTQPRSRGFPDDAVAAFGGGDRRPRGDYGFPDSASSAFQSKQRNRSRHTPYMRARTPPPPEPEKSYDELFPSLGGAGVKAVAGTGAGAGAGVGVGAGAGAGKPSFADLARKAAAEEEEEQRQRDDEMERERQDALRKNHEAELYRRLHATRHAYDDHGYDEHYNEEEDAEYVSPGDLDYVNPYEKLPKTASKLAFADMEEDEDENLSDTHDAEEGV
jgi:hypothetical protein